MKSKILQYTYNIVKMKEITTKSKKMEKLQQILFSLFKVHIQASFSSFLLRRIH